jgi:hypothetical protein
VDKFVLNYQPLLGDIRHLLKRMDFDEEAAALDELMKRAKEAPYDAACHKKMQQLLARLQRLDMTERSLAFLVGQRQVGVVDFSTGAVWGARF